MSIFINILLFAVGLAAIVKGADWLTDNAANIAHRYGIPTLVIGLTIVAIGTSAPEFVVSMLGALRHDADIAIGNVVGSNIFNILGMIGSTAIISPILLTRSNVIRDLPIMVLSSVVLFIMLLDTFFDSSIAENSLNRSDGLILICMFLLFMYYTMRIAKKNKKEESDKIDKSKLPPMWRCVLGFLIGLGCLIVGGNFMVDGASGIARALGVGDAIIALTIVSIGTSAPELATSIMAAKKGDNDMAVGNVVGSVVFNTLLVLGASSVVFPLPMEGITFVDMSVLLFASFMFWGCATFGTKRFTLTRTDGILMVVCQIAYYIYLICNA